MAIPELTQEKTNTLKREEQQNAQIIEINKVLHVLCGRVISQTETLENELKLIMSLRNGFLKLEKRIAALERKKKR